MAFKARLNFSGKEYDVLHCAYALNRDVDAKGRPSSRVYGGTIDNEIDSIEDTSFIEAVVNNQYKPIAGSLLIKKIDEVEVRKIAGAQIQALTNPFSGYQA